MRANESIPTRNDHQSVPQTALSMLEMPGGAAVRVEMRGDPSTREGVLISERELPRFVESGHGVGRGPDHSHEGRAAAHSGPRGVRETHGFGIE